jgi:hypothetical protein
VRDLCLTQAQVSASNSVNNLLTVLTLAFHHRNLPIMQQKYHSCTLPAPAVFAPVRNIQHETLSGDAAS